MKPVVIRNALPAETFAEVKRMVAEIGRTIESAPVQESTCPQAWHSSVGTPWMEALHENLTGRVAEHVGKPTKPTVSYLLFLRPGYTIVPHRDPENRPITFDLCVSLREPWPIIVEGEIIDLRENDALLFEGRRQEHWRHGPLKQGNPCTMFLLSYQEIERGEQVSSLY